MMAIGVRALGTASAQGVVLHERISTGCDGAFATDMRLSMSTSRTLDAWSSTSDMVGPNMLLAFML